jgi:hypothetical protein
MLEGADGLGGRVAASHAKASVLGEREAERAGLFHVEHSLQRRKVSAEKRRISTTTTKMRVLGVKMAL